VYLQHHQRICLHLQQYWRICNIIAASATALAQLQ
jgi:hypothetical protein